MIDRDDIRVWGLAALFLIGMTAAVLA